MIHSIATDLAKAHEYAQQASRCDTYANTITRLAAEIVDTTLELHNSDPLHRAGLSFAQQLRKSADGFTEAGELYRERVREHEAHAAVAS